MRSSKHFVKFLGWELARPKRGIKKDVKDRETENEGGRTMVNGMRRRRR